MKTDHNIFIRAFKHDAAVLLQKYIPGKVQLARRDINAYLKKEDDKLRRWHAGLMLNLLTSEEFGKLFAGLRNSFQLKELRLADLSPEQLFELTLMLRKLFRAMMVTYATQRHEAYRVTLRLSKGGVSWRI